MAGAAATTMTTTRPVHRASISAFHPSTATAAASPYRSGSVTIDRATLAAITRIAATTNAIDGDNAAAAAAATATTTTAALVQLRSCSTSSAGHAAASVARHFEAHARRASLPIGGSERQFAVKPIFSGLRPSQRLQAFRRLCKTRSSPPFMQTASECCH